MSIGVIAHIHNPTLADVRGLARAAEDAGADWLGVPDAFWWRDAWLLAAEAARATTRLTVGPLVTNPYLRHPFHTLAAVATLQEIAGPRVLLGLGAGGSELPLSTGIDRRDAPQRVGELVALIDRVAAGAPLSDESRRTLEVPLSRPPIVVAGRSAGILRTAGAVADHALLWAVPRSELASSAALVAEGAAARAERPALIWAPLLVEGDDWDAVDPPHAAAYAALNSRPATRRAWGLDETRVGEIRRGLVAGEPVERLVPEVVLRDVIIPTGARDEAALLARSIAADAIAVPAYDVAQVAPRVAWARDVLSSTAEGREDLAAERLERSQ